LSALQDLIAWPIDRIAHTILPEKPGNIVITSVPTTRFMSPPHASMMPFSLRPMVLCHVPRLLVLSCRTSGWHST
jgi:hypothetical protein